jgi:uncharacterized protein (TIGR01777 family)
MTRSGSARVLLSGGSGLIGRALLPALKAQGCGVIRLVRGTPSGDEQIHWDPTQPVSPAALSGFDSVIHLAGESVVGRWTVEKKAAIRNSRVQGTRHLALALAQAKSPPRLLISASAIGYYGDRADEILREESFSGRGFLAEVCRDWEAASGPASQAGIRTVQMRIGVVLSSSGGALSKMLPPFRMGLGGNLGSGRQWMSWIHIQDLVAAVRQILGDEALQGPINLVAPEPVTNANFTRTLASVLARPALCPVPGFAARLLFGQMAEEVLLASQRVEPAKLLAGGFVFQYSDLRIALESLLRASSS